MTKTFYTALLAAAAFAMSANTAWANLAWNGNFQGTPTASGEPPTTIPLEWGWGGPGSASESNMTQQALDPTFIAAGSPLAAITTNEIRYEGTATDGTNDCLFQDLAGLVLGQQYTLTFWVAISPSSLTGNDNVHLDVNWNENTATQVSLAGVYNAPTSGMKFTEFTFTGLTAANTTADRLDFHASDTNGMLLLAAVDLEATGAGTPEPGSIALLGAGLLGAALLKRGRIARTR